MTKLFIIALLLAGTTASSVSAEKMTGLPSPDDVFVVAVFPRQERIKEYFTPDSLLEALPILVPSDVRLPVGDREYWQSGVIVLKSKEVLFWRTCGDWFIAVDSLTGPIFYAKEKGSSQQGVAPYVAQGAPSGER